MNDTHQVKCTVAVLPPPTIANDVPVADVLDRYAHSIVGDNPDRYDTVEVHGVRNYSLQDDATHCQIDNLDSTAFSVYVRIKSGGLECVGDFTHYADAERYGGDLSVEYSWPVRNFVLEKHRCTKSASLQ